MKISYEFKQELEKETKEYINEEKIIINFLDNNICSYERKKIIIDGCFVKGYDNVSIHHHITKDDRKPRKSTCDKYDATFNSIKKNIECYSERECRYNSDVKGVYIFVAIDKIEFTIYDAFKKFIKFDVDNDEINFSLMPTPKINTMDSNNISEQKIIIEKGELIYVGESTKLADRISEHQYGILGSTGSMKFSVRSDIFTSSNYKVYAIKLNEKKDRSFCEKYIRNAYVPVFGK